jgi:alanine racemase
MAVRALAAVNLAAIERNCRRLRRELTGGAELAVVVKADGYGHGAVPAARAALAGGATRLCVAAAAEARDLRAAGIDAPVLVMGALSDEELPVALDTGAEVVAWREAFVERLGRAAGEREVPVHVKLDTGMGRLGTRDPQEALRVAEAVASATQLRLAGAMTHFATADEPDDDFLGAQLERFAPFAERMRADHPGVVVHAANSAATLREPAAHFDLVRCGIAVYGMDPFHEDPGARELEPALELTSYVAEVKPCARGESAGYGRTFVAARDTVLAVLPIGYGDGWRRGLGNRAHVLVGGERRPLVGTVSMDNVTVDLGPGTGMAPGERAVLIGADGAERITAEEVARHLDTINYEVTCGLTARVPRAYHRDGEPV